MHLIQSGCSYHETENESWLDVALVDSQSKILTFTKSEQPFIDHHDSFIINYDFSARPLETNSYTFRNFRHCNFVEMETDLKLVVSHQSSALDHLPINDVLNNFSSDLLFLLNKHAPFHTIKCRNKHKPWLNSQIIECNFKEK